MLQLSQKLFATFSSTFDEFEISNYSCTVNNLNPIPIFHSPAVGSLLDGTFRSLDLLNAFPQVVHWKALSSR